MQITKAEFIKSSPDTKSCPTESMPEFAFVGRSNVGKSSLINFLTDRKKLAKTSSTPGKTQLINHFLINHNWYLVDLPGYGYAKVSKKIRQELMNMIENYLTNRPTMVCLFLLIDIRHKPQASDLQFMEWLGTNGIPFVIVFTKSDKLGKIVLSQNIEFYKNELLKSWESLPEIFLSSTLKKLGRDEILNYIQNTIDKINFK